MDEVHDQKEAPKPTLTITWDHEAQDAVIKSEGFRTMEFSLAVLEFAKMKIDTIRKLQIQRNMAQPAMSVPRDLLRTR